MFIETLSHRKLTAYKHEYCSSVRGERRISAGSVAFEIEKFLGIGKDKRKQRRQLWLETLRAFINVLSVKTYGKVECFPLRRRSSSSRCICNHRDPASVDS